MNNSQCLVSKQEKNIQLKTEFIPKTSLNFFKLCKLKLRTYSVLKYICKCVLKF